MKTRQLLALFMAGFFAFAMPSLPVLAAETEDATVTDKVCDPNVFARMRQKAWAEAQRENISTQSIITRPANTFALTCFDKQVGMAMNNGVNESGTTTRYENAVQNNAGGISGGLIGSSGTMIPDVNGGSTTTSYSKPPSKTGSYNCDNMDKMWKAAQCSNMQGKTFPSLKEVTNDSRDYPAACSTSKDDTGSYTYASALGDIYAVGANIAGYDKMSTHFCQTGPLSEVKAAKNSGGADACPQQDGSYCWPGKKTGLKLSDQKDEITCSNPGCAPKLDGSEYKCRPVE